MSFEDMTRESRIFGFRDFDDSCSGCPCTLEKKCIQESSIASDSDDDASITALDGKGTSSMLTPFVSNLILFEKHLLKL